MILSSKTLEKLRNLINEETEYRSGPKLVDFFNHYGFSDIYYRGFPSRWMYTDSKLKAINGTIEIDKCIKDLFAPVNFIGRYKDLDKYIADFNRYLSFDGWQVRRECVEIVISKSKGINIDEEVKKDISLNETDFLKQEFAEINIQALPIDGSMVSFLENRILEIEKCLSVKAPLSAIFLTGSSLEGILLGVALNYPSLFNKAKSAPKDPRTGKVRNFYDWNLNNLIDVSHEVGFLKEDVKKFSHVLRDFRNYIHPYEQMSHNFHPDEHTAKICCQVLKAALYQIETNSHSC